MWVQLLFAALDGSRGNSNADNNKVSVGMFSKLCSFLEAEATPTDTTSSTRQPDARV